jgi:hypothetical protein
MQGAGASVDKFVAVEILRSQQRATSHNKTAATA